MIAASAGRHDHVDKPSTFAKRFGGFLVSASLALVVSNCAEKPKAGPQLSLNAVEPPVEQPQEVAKTGKNGTDRSYKIAGKTYTPQKNPTGYKTEGLASWYGPRFHGKRTSNGETFDMTSISAAHPTLPLPSYARVTNVVNGRSIIVRVNDRGPFHGGRVVDVSQRTADLLDFRRKGMARVKVEYVGPAAPGGSDEKTLMASYSENGKKPSMTGTLLAALTPDFLEKKSTPAAEPAPEPVVAEAPAAIEQPKPQIQPVAVAAVEAPKAKPAAEQAPAIAGATTPPAEAKTAEAGNTPETQAASRIASGFAAMDTAKVPQLDAAALMQPVLGSMAFSPSPMRSGAP